jgi:hypothetical protein
MSSPMWQTVLGMLQKMDPSSLVQLQLPDISEPVNAIGADIDKALHPDLHNIWMGAVTVQQPVFVGERSCIPTRWPPGGGPGAVQV